MSGDSRIYFDSNVFIYAIEGDAEIADPLRQLLDILRNRPGLAVTSELTLAEVLPKADLAQRLDYLDLIADSGVLGLRAVSREILIETATYRRAFGMQKLPDAVHVVTAIRSACSKLLSDDQRLKLPEGITLIDTTPDSLSSLIQELA